MSASKFLFRSSSEHSWLFNSSEASVLFRFLSFKAFVFSKTTFWTSRIEFCKLSSALWSFLSTPFIVASLLSLSTATLSFKISFSRCNSNSSLLAFSSSFSRISETWCWKMLHQSLDLTCPGNKERFPLVQSIAFLWALFSSALLTAFFLCHSKYLQKILNWGS